MDPAAFLGQLRQQPFYFGQILRVRSIPPIAGSFCGVEQLPQEAKGLSGGSLPGLLSAAGHSSVSASLLGGLRQAFPAKEGRKGAGGVAGIRDDSVLEAAYSFERELFWQLVCFVEALDLGAGCLVVCPGPAEAVAAGRALDALIDRTGIRYALRVDVATEPSHLLALAKNPAPIVVLTPWTLRTLLQSPEYGGTRDTFLASLRRIVLPGVDGWSGPLATNSVFLFRQLNVAVARRGGMTRIAATACPSANLLGYVSALVGRTVDSTAVVRSDTVPAGGILLVNYTGGLTRDEGDSKAWVRQDRKKIARDLLGWLVGELPGEPADELHYLVDVSVSMESRLGTVKEAIQSDLDDRLGAGTLARDARLRLTAFDVTATQVFSAKVDEEAAPARFRSALASLKIGGGTDIAEALGAALKATLTGSARKGRIFLFSDGESFVKNEQKTSLLELARSIERQGRSFDLDYFVLDAQPLEEVRTLVVALGGRVLTRETKDLPGSGTLDGSHENDRGDVVVLSGPDGLPGDIVQGLQAGRRRIRYVRKLELLDAGPATGASESRSVFAVVVSGRFGRIDEILEQVRHLSHEMLPVFVLTEAEGAAQTLVEDFPETTRVERALLAFPRNPLVTRMRLEEALAGGAMEIAEFSYLLEGEPKREAFERSLREPDSPEATTKMDQGLPEGLELVPGKRQLVRLVKRDAVAPVPTESPLDSYTPERFHFDFEGVSGWAEASLLAFRYHEGAVVEAGDGVAEVASSRPSPPSVSLRRRSMDRYFPVVSRLGLRLLSRESHLDDSVLGDFQGGRVALSGELSAVRRFPGGNLDDQSSILQIAPARGFSLETWGFKWKPMNASGDVVAGLASAARLALVCLLPDPVYGLAVVPSGDGEIWFVDLAPGGSGMSASVDPVLAADRDALRHLLALGGRIVIDCPCETGLAGATMESVGAALADAGCPRCLRPLGPEFEHSTLAASAAASKRKTLEWLAAAGILPMSAKLHIGEKFEGIHDALRIAGDDVGTRSGILKRVRRVLADRLGLVNDPEEDARFKWLEDADTKRCLGLYEPSSNILRLLDGMKEWQSFDVAAHEYFHNLQWKLPDLFNYQKLGHEGELKPPFEGKLFIEGSAMWAESQVADSLALRTALHLSNLRQGDEYGVGFQLMKLIEERYGGVEAVLSFLRTGDIGLASKGRVKSLETLYSELGIE
jgi:hypothetical protein